MYICPKCKKFGSVGPGNCWKCGARLVPREYHVLFVGIIDGRPELEFLRFLDRFNCVAHLTTYGPAPAELRAWHGRRIGTARIVVEENIDATQLEAHYPDVRFDAIVWIGPTNDGNLADTPDLVRLFIASAAGVASEDGIAFVVQDTKTPNFRDILTLPGAFICCPLALPGRTQTQHSNVKKVMDQRLDQLIAFTFKNGRVRLSHDNAPFKSMLTRIMSYPAKLFNMPKDQARFNPNFKSKAEIANMIFAYADNIREAPEPGSVYTCPRCRKFSRIGPGSCWKCGCELVPR